MIGIGADPTGPSETIVAAIVAPAAPRQQR
jgi:hypothetical protein